MIELLCDADPASAVNTAIGIAGGGWASFGLAGLVLWWLAWHHLPAKDKQINDLIVSRDKIIVDLVTAHNARIDEKDKQIMLILQQAALLSGQERDKFSESLDKVVLHCADENQKARDSWTAKIEQHIQRALVKSREPEKL